MFGATRFAVFVCVVAVSATARLHAQSTPSSALDPGGPPPPVAPEVETTDGEGRFTLRATRISEPLKLDGMMDEPVYQQVKPITGFQQMQPEYGAPVSAQTEVWILYDDKNFYLTCRCTNGSAKMVLDDMRRDLANQGDYISFNIDTFLDRRNSFLFYVNPLAGLVDGLVTDETSRNDSWNGVWDAKATRSEGGWIGEIAIPFKTLRYRPGRDQVWGIIMRRRIRANGDEHGFLPLVPQAWGAGAGGRVSRAATVVGLQAPPPALNFEVKPYLTGGLRTDLQASPPTSNDPDRDFGFDVKYGITKSLTLDATYNTDFAQVEADQTQINLTRFSLFFPEKRDFFLEGQGLFSFGGANAGGGGQEPVMFFSRQIGLFQGRPIPIVGGARVTGRVDRYSIGALSITTDDDRQIGVPQTTFDVVRLKRDLLRRSSVGALFTHRSESLTDRGSNQLYGADGNFNFFDNLHFNTYLAKTATSGLEGDDLSYRAQMSYDADRYGLEVDRIVVGDNFNPEVGFLRRQDYRQFQIVPRFSPRPRGDVAVRKYNYQASLNYITNNQYKLETREAQAQFRIDFRNSDNLTVSYNRNYELVPSLFSISEGVRILAGGYDAGVFRVSYMGGQQRRISGTGSMETGDFYGGSKTTASFSGRVKFGIRLSIEPTLQFDAIDIPQASLITKVVSARTNYSFTPRMFFSGLLQHNSTTSSFSANLRFRWEYQPGSDFFIVYTEGRDTFEGRGFPLENRGIAVKLTRLVRF